MTHVNVSSLLSNLSFYTGLRLLSDAVCIQGKQQESHKALVTHPRFERTMSDLDNIITTIMTQDNLSRRDAYLTFVKLWKEKVRTLSDIQRTYKGQKRDSVFSRNRIDLNGLHLLRHLGKENARVNYEKERQHEMTQYLETIKA